MIKQHILVTVDDIVFTIADGSLQILFIKRSIEPFKWEWALPGWFVRENETLQEAAYRKLAEETSVKNAYLEQLYTFSEVNRDPRWRAISCAYIALMSKENIVFAAGSDASEAKFFDVKKLPKLAFDHKKIVEYAIQRLKRKMEYTNVAQYILPKKFTLRQLQDVYETTLDQRIDVRNFRKKIEKLDLIKATWEKEIGVKYRPAKLYTFVHKNIKIVDIM
ncbi:MAG: Nudix hydrolase [uncultured bacterium (gcode 4)]|uniref:Nudix hydrolase n=1 Tax=uncultured bacterium (gcode 4) TaxID=1234023 RepID=K1YH87_9BACT|nr:MAG: Nudix hydrolase [uncultured bacterium (gcode 4)]